MSKRIFFNIVCSFLILLFLISCIESLTYYGFFLKHINPIISTVLVLLTVATFFVIVKIGKSKTYLKIVALATYLTTFIYFIFRVVEHFQYSNYVFSHFHVNPDLLFLPVVLISIIFILNEDKKAISRFLYMIIVLSFVQFIVNDIDHIKGDRPLFILKNISLNYENKMGMKIGATPINYAIFIRNNTPSNSNILIPPQGFPWSQTGNVAYLRYFLYPRNLINGNEKDPKIDINTIDYVLIDYGEDNTFEYGFTNVWPKFDVKGEYILYWNPSTYEVTKSDIDVYRYSNQEIDETWGIIKVKK